MNDDIPTAAPIMYAVRCANAHAPSPLLSVLLQTGSTDSRCLLLALRRTGLLFPCDSFFRDLIVLGAVLAAQGAGR